MQSWSNVSQRARQAVYDKRKKKLPPTATVANVQAACQDPLIQVKLAFFASVKKWTVQPPDRTAYCKDERSGWSSSGPTPPSLILNFFNFY